MKSIGLSEYEPIPKNQGYLESPKFLEICEESVKKRAKKQKSKKISKNPKLNINYVTEGQDGQICSSGYVKNKPPPGKRRGRKREKDETYFEKTLQKIEQIREKLKTAKEDGLTVKERQKLRNQISAQHSRMVRKQESQFLNSKIKEKDDKMQKLVECMIKVLKKRPKYLIEINNLVNEEWDTKSDNLMTDFSQSNPNSTFLA